jgi:hypothetical protein
MAMNMDFLLLPLLRGSTDDRLGIGEGMPRL